MIKNIAYFLAILSLVIAFQVFKKPISKFVRSYTDEFREYEIQRAVNLASQIPTETWEEKFKNMQIKDKYKVVFFTGTLGEESYAEYFKYGAEKKGWEVKVYIGYPDGIEDELIAFNPDMILAANYGGYKNTAKITAHRSKKYYINFMSLDSVINGQTNEFLPFHGLLTALPCIDLFNQAFKKHNKPFYGFRLLPSVTGDENTDVAEPNTIMWSGSNWDKLRSSAKYSEFLTLLSTNLPLKTYGPYGAYSSLSKGVYDGFVAPGPANIKAMRLNGIYLASHGHWHFTSNTPSIKLLEALAANVIIITDRLPFIVENFGDDVLYFDNKLEPQEMMSQIKDHYDWIKAHPEEAKAKAARAHKTYLEKFALEIYLEKLAKMHELVLSDERSMGLRYNLGY